MGIITRRNGKIIIMLGFLLGIAGAVGVISTAAVLGHEPDWAYNPAALTFSFLFIIGPMLTVLGIPVLVISILMWPRTCKKMNNILKIVRHVKIDTIAQQLSVSEKEVIQAVARLQSNGEPITIDHSINEVIYDHALLPPPPQFAEVKTPPIKSTTVEWTSYEKLSMILGVTGIVISVILTLLR